MVSQETAEAGAEGLSVLGRNGENGGGSNEGIQVAAGNRGGSTGIRYGDYRVDAPDEPDVSNLSLADYVVVKEGKKKGKSKKNAEVEESTAVQDGPSSEILPSVPTATEIVTCPVCGAFEGDEAAVAHHVNEHFD